MGNKIIHVYNGTDRNLKIEVRLEASDETPFADVIIPSDRLTRFANLRKIRPLLTVRILDDQGRSLSTCDFHSYYDHSWVVTENYVYRQKYGEPLTTIADKADEFEYSEERYSTELDYKMKYCDVILRYSLRPIWSTRRPTTVGGMWTYANKRHNTEQDKELIEAYVLKLIGDMSKGEMLTLELITEYSLKEILLQSVIAS